MKVIKVHQFLYFFMKFTREYVYFLQISMNSAFVAAGRLVELLDSREVDAQHPEPALVELSLPPANDLLHICWLH